MALYFAPQREATFRRDGCLSLRKSVLDRALENSAPGPIYDPRPRVTSTERSGVRDINFGTAPARWVPFNLFITPLICPLSLRFFVPCFLLISIGFLCFIVFFLNSFAYFRFFAFFECTNCLLNIKINRFLLHFSSFTFFLSSVGSFH